MALTRITKGVIKPNENYDTHNINSTGIVTAVGADFSGNVSVGGVLTYEDVTSIDSVGLITARDGIFIPDNKKAEFGNVAGTADFDIVHDGNNTVFHNRTGGLFIKGISGSGNSIYMQPKNNESSATFHPDGAVELYHNNLLRLATDANGVQIKPNVGGVTQLGIAQTTTTAYSINGSVSFINSNNTTAQIQGRTGAASTTGDLIFLCNAVGDETLAILEDGKVRVPDRGSFVVGQGNDLTLKHDTNSTITNTTGQLAIENTAGNLSIKASNTNGDIIMRAGGGTSSENAIVAVHHGEVVLSFNGATKLSTTNTGINILGTVVATGADINGDIDVDGHTNLDNVSIAGVTTSSGNLTIQNNFPSLFLVDTDHNDDYSIQNQNGYFAIKDESDGHNRLVIHPDGTAVINGNLDVGSGLDVTGNANISGGLIFAGDTDTFIDHPYSNQIEITTNNIEVATFIDGQSNRPAMLIDKGGVNNTTAGSNFNSNGNANDLVVGNVSSGNHGITICSHNAGSGSLNFSDGSGGGADAYRGSVSYNHVDEVTVVRAKDGKVVLRNNNIDTVTCDSSGKFLVGIHTSSNYTWNPTARFATETSGDASSIHFGNSTNAGIVMLRRGGSTSWHHHAGKIYTDHRPAIHFETAYATAIGNHSFQHQMTMKHNAGVGIGTVDPSTKLHIFDSSSDPYLRIGGGGRDCGIQLDANTNFTALRTDAANRLYVNAGGDSIRFSIGGTTSSNEKLRITSSGKVGINIAGSDNTSPVRNLDIADSSGAILRLISTDDSLGANERLGEIEFYSDDDDNAHIGAFIKAIADPSDVAGRRTSLIFGTQNHDASVNAVEKVRIDCNGSMGLGTNSPVAKFHVHNSGTGHGDHAYAYFTTGDTGATSGDGLTIGVNATATAVVNFREAGNLSLGTSSTERLLITSVGEVIIKPRTGGSSNDRASIHFNNNVHSPYITFKSNNLVEAAHINAGENGGGCDLSFKTKNQSGTSLKRLTLKNNGEIVTHQLAGNEKGYPLVMGTGTVAQNTNMSGSFNYHDVRGVHTTGGPNYHIGGWVFLGNDQAAAPYPVRRFQIAKPGGFSNGTIVYQIWHNGDSNYDYGGLFEVRINCWTGSSRFESVSIRCVNGKRDDVHVIAYNDTKGIMVQPSSIWGQMFIRRAGYDDGGRNPGSSYCAVANNGALAIYNSSGTDDGTPPSGGFNLYAFGTSDSSTHTGGRDIENSNSFPG